MLESQPEPEIVMRWPDGNIEPFDLPREVVRKIVIYRKLIALGFSEEEVRFLLTADTF